jgi:hypothetical protein
VVAGLRSGTPPALAPTCGSPPRGCGCGAQQRRAGPAARART